MSVPSHWLIGQNNCNDESQGFRGQGGLLTIFGEAAALAQPGKSPLDCPADGQAVPDFDSFGRLRILSC